MKKPFVLLVSLVLIVVVGFLVVNSSDNPGIPRPTLESCVTLLGWVQPAEDFDVSTARKRLTTPCQAHYGVLFTQPKPAESYCQRFLRFGDDKINFDYRDLMGDVCTILYLPGE